MPRRIKTIFIGAECAPLVKVGGLGDVMGSLPIALAKLGVDATVVLPFYGLIDTKKYKVKLVARKIRFSLNGQLVSFDLYQTQLSGSKVKVWLIKNKIFNHKAVYLGGRKYLREGRYTRRIKDVERFVFFSKAAVEAIRYTDARPDVVHIHDWHTALVPTFIDEYSLMLKNFGNIKTLFTIHNLANQGVAELDIVDYASLHVNLTPAVMEDYYDRDGDVVDLMKIGILSADKVNTVSPTYAKEILSKEYGEGLEKYLQRRKKDLSGILNGIDTDLFDPSKDKNIKFRYDSKTFLAGKEANKKYLQKNLGLAVDKNIAFYGLVSRLVEQKGLDILERSLAELLPKQQMQVVILGSGQSVYEQKLRELAKKYPSKLSVNIGFNVQLAQQIYAASDFFLMPSRFEPCGLGQMIATRYGTIPIVRDTGGLHDSIKNKKTGIVFSQYSADKLSQAMISAQKLFTQKAKMHKIIREDFVQNFSWRSSAKKYRQIYERLI